MLRQLVDYAYKHGLELEPGFGPRIVKWAITFSEDMDFLEVVELGDTSQKRNPGRRFPKCPDLGQSELVSGSERRSHFLVETVGVVALHGVAQEDTGTKQKHDYFIRLLSMAGERIPPLGRLAQRLQDPSTTEEIRRQLEESTARPQDKVTCRIGDCFPVEEDSWHDWWRDFRSSLQKEGKTEMMLDLSTGQTVIPTPTHYPKIIGLVNVDGRPSGDALVSFDKEAFRSYGLEQSANAAMSEESAKTYISALNHLLSQYGERIGMAKVVHWYKEPVVVEDDPISWMRVGDTEELDAQESARKLLENLRAGQKPAGLLSNHFYALTLSGMAGRVMVRDWMEGDFAELVANISQWFSDLEISNLAGSQARLPGLQRILECPLSPRKPSQRHEDWVRPVQGNEAKLLRAAVEGRPLPYSILARVTLANRDSILTGELEETEQTENRRNRPAVLSRLYVRMGLIKLYHLRIPRKEAANSMAEIKSHVNPEHPDPAYQCGRLMAVMAGLQKAALPEVGAGIVQRYYAAASSTPALVLGRLTRTSQYHLSQIGRDRPGLAFWYENQIGGIWSAIRDTVPRTLTLEEQSLFALGYYQQMAQIRSPSVEKQQSETETEEDLSND